MINLIKNFLTYYPVSYPNYRIVITGLSPITVNWDDEDISNFHDEIKTRIVPLLDGFVTSIVVNVNEPHVSRKHI